jgi:uncharacterized protein YjbI with pentapeptide repeats
MQGTFLGKWKIGGPSGFLSYEDRPWPEMCSPANPKATHVAVILRDHGQVCFHLNNGKYIGASPIGGCYLLEFVDTLDAAQGFTFLGRDSQGLPTSFTNWITTPDFSLQVRDLPLGTIMLERVIVFDDQSGGPPVSFTMTQVTPAPPNVQRGSGDGLDYAWVDFTSSGLNFPPNQSGRFSLRNADFSYCRFPAGGALQVVYLDFTGATWHSANLQGTVIYNCSLRQADLSNCDLTGASVTSDIIGQFNDLTGANLTDANLTNASFSGTPMPDSTLKNCNLTGTNFTGTNISGANLVGSTFTGTNLSRAVAAGAVFTGADLTSVIASPLPQFYTTPLAAPSASNPRTTLAQCHLNQSLLGIDWSMLDLTDAVINGIPHDLSGLKASYLIAPKINLSNHILKNAVFDDADLTGANFSHSDLTGASFARAKLTGAIFTQATLNGANLGAAQLGDLNGTNAADLSYANMRGTIFDHANLDHCNFNKAQWYGSVPLSPTGTDVQPASGANASLQNATFANAVLSELHLNEAHLETADFANAVLVGAKLTGAWAQGAKFTEAHLQGADFTNAKLQGARLGGASVAFAHGVFLFDLDGRYTGDLINLNVSSQLQGAFEDKGYGLLDSPSVTADSPTGGGGWTVSNTASVSPTTSAYSEFKIVANSHGRLLVYGSAIYVTQVTDAGQLETTTVPYAATILTKDNCTLSDDTVFPNGEPYSTLNNGYSWEQLMTVDSPPKPPPCVSTGNDWDCPSQQP